MKNLASTYSGNPFHKNVAGGEWIMTGDNSSRAQRRRGERLIKKFRKWRKNKNHSELQKIRKRKAGTKRN